MSLGEKIARLRKTQGWTQSQFAEKVGVHNRHISRWETNKNRPSLAMLEKIAAVFEVSVDELTDAEGRKSAESVLHNNRLLKQFELVQALPQEEQNVITRVIDAFVTKRRMEEVLGSV